MQTDLGEAAELGVCLEAESENRSKGWLERDGGFGIGVWGVPRVVILNGPMRMCKD